MPHRPGFSLTFAKQRSVGLQAVELVELCDELDDDEDDDVDDVNVDKEVDSDDEDDEDCDGETLLDDVVASLVAVVDVITGLTIAPPVGD